MHGDAAEILHEGIEAKLENDACDLRIGALETSLTAPVLTGAHAETGREVRCDPIIRVDNHMDAFSAVTLGASILAAYGVSQIQKRF